MAMRRKNSPSPSRAAPSTPLPHFVGARTGAKARNAVLAPFGGRGGEPEGRAGEGDARPRRNSPYVGNCVAPMSRLLPLLTWLGLPIYVWQGIGVRRRTERMMPAEGPVLHRIEGADPAVSLLVLGDSSAASVGIGHSENGLAAQLSGLISARTGRAVNWRAAGFNSAT